MGTVYLLDWLQQSCWDQEDFGRNLGSSHRRSGVRKGRSHLSQSNLSQASSIVLLNSDLSWPQLFEWCTSSEVPSSIIWALIHILESCPDEEDLPDGWCAAAKALFASPLLKLSLPAAQSLAVLLIQRWEGQIKAATTGTQSLSDISALERESPVGQICALLWKQLYSQALLLDVWVSLLVGNPSRQVLPDVEVPFYERWISLHALVQQWQLFPLPSLPEWIATFWSRCLGVWVPALREDDTASNDWLLLTIFCLHTFPQLAASLCATDFNAHLLFQIILAVSVQWICVDDPSCLVFLYDANTPEKKTSFTATMLLEMCQRELQHFWRETIPLILGNLPLPLAWQTWEGWCQRQQVPWEGKLDISVDIQLTQDTFETLFASVLPPVHGRGANSDKSEWNDDVSFIVACVRRNLLAPIVEAGFQMHERHWDIVAERVHEPLASLELWLDALRETFGQLVESLVDGVQNASYLKEEKIEALRAALRGLCGVVHLYPEILSADMADLLIEACVEGGSACLSLRPQFLGLLWNTARFYSNAVIALDYERLVRWSYGMSISWEQRDSVDFGTYTLKMLRLIQAGSHTALEPAFSAALVQSVAGCSSLRMLHDRRFKCQSKAEYRYLVRDFRYCERHYGPSLSAVLLKVDGSVWETLHLPEKELFEGLAASSEDYQRAIYVILSKYVPAAWAGCLDTLPSADEGDLDMQTSHMQSAIPSYLLEAIMDVEGKIDLNNERFLVGEDSDLPALRGFVLTWMVFFNWMESLQTHARSRLTEWLSATGFTNRLLDLTLQVVSPLFSGSSTRTPFKPLVEEPGAEVDDFRPQLLMLWAAFKVFSATPRVTRVWFASLTRTQRSNMEKLTASLLSPALIKKELAAVESNRASVPDLTVKVVKSSLEVGATYFIDDISYEINIRMKGHHPLEAPTVECSRATGISQARWRRWLFSIATLLANKDGSILDALVLWQDNLNKEMSGLEDCPICFSIVHASNYSLPKLSCATCGLKFHSNCLYKWFQTSQQNKCPHCQSPFMVSPHRK